MSLLNKSKYHNFLDKITISHTVIEDLIENYDLEFFSWFNCPKAEDIKLPPFLYPFYKHLPSGLLITQNEFWILYQEENKNDDDLIKWKNDDFMYFGIKKRAYRTYPSLVRDIHYATFLKSINMNVIYSGALDRDEGIDLLLEVDRNLFALNLFTNTEKAKYWREKKNNNRHKQYDNVGSTLKDA